MRFRALWPDLFWLGKERLPGLEFIIDAGADHALVEDDADRGSGKAVGEPARRVLETGGQIFGLRRPIVGHGDFDTDA